MTNARKSREDRAAKIEQMRREEAGKARRKRIGIVAGSAVAVLAVAGGVTALVLNEGGDPAVDMAAVQSFDKLTSNHVEAAVTYPQTPPVGGDHNPVWQNCGVYPEQVPNEHAVHSMEHGAVWITYQPSLAGDAKEQLTDLVQDESYLLLSPYPNLPSPIVASAWGKQLKVTSATDPRLEEFIDEYKQGPQTPEPGAACTGGIGTPQE